MDLGEALRERTLVIRCQLGDRDAFGATIRTLYGPVHDYLSRLIDSGVDADDVSQVVWLRVLERLPSLRHPEAFRGWLYRIARNEGIQHLRRAQRHARLGALAASSETPTAEVGSPEMDSEPLRGSAWLDVARDRVSAVQMEALRLHYIHGLSYEEVSLATGVP